MSVRGKWEELVGVTGLVRVGLVEVWLDRVGFTHKERGGMVRLAGIEGLVDVGLVLVVMV